MAKGDVLLLYTDGVSEATNEHNQFYGEQRMVKLLQQNAKETAKVITQIQLEDVQKFNALGTQSDDKTIVTIKRTA
jgi:sigma-B regulation protein RsbU (phosphoserine phosphatase)